MRKPLRYKSQVTRGEPNRTSYQIAVPSSPTSHLEFNTITSAKVIDGFPFYSPDKTTCRLPKLGGHRTRFKAKEHLQWRHGIIVLVGGQSYDSYILAPCCGGHSDSRASLRRTCAELPDERRQIGSFEANDFSEVHGRRHLLLADSYGVCIRGRWRRRRRRWVPFCPQQ